MALSGTTATFAASLNCPTVAIVIPAKNEASYIARCLAAVRAQDYPSDRIDMVVVDNGSTDRTAEIVTASGVTLLHHPGGRVGAVRNAGAMGATADVLAFLDADCVTRKDWLSSAVARLSDPGIGIAGGGYLADRDGTWVQRAWAPTIAGPTTETPALPGGSIIVSRALFETLGGFSEVLSAGEDDDFCRRVRERGLKVLAVHESAVIHLGYPRTLRAVARRQVWHGSYQLDVAESWRERQLLLTHAFALGVVSLPIAPWLGLPLLAVPVLVMSGSKAARRDDRLPTLLRMLPVAMAFYAGRAVGLVRNYARLLTSGAVGH